MKAIFKREISNYLNNPMGYVFLGIFILMFSGIFCYMNLYGLTSSDISYTFQWMIYVMLGIMPLLTMRLMAEEKAAKTDQLLLTTPVSSVAIVAGKFFAVMALCVLALLFTAPHIIILVFRGNPSFLSTLLAYFGFLLYASVYAAIGLFISSLTENQVVSAVITFASFIAMLALELLILPAVQSPVLYNVLGSISFASRYVDFSLGILNITSVIYYISVAVMFNFFTVISIERRRW